ncbi:cytochrome c1 [Komagataeibacter intermedius]|uniref:Cytochrome c1 n=1 Tax=Komagataeibacter intermedius AF2 TaxID=1458464 RepID=A0A0N1FCX4_9PROT|nr:cytochrome c1 [Komagataeibacter intermedius]KPH87670.1 ubiquinol-cytochrome C reductase [Komagataeibacter intermedius AF2]MCF3636390.1 cytochrome c1 [Komagataeibacter intermedius]GAN85841.1 ubiquinol-cytochrome c reductase cytochrome c1 [Komagataeibacter intermedius TF2]
MHERSQQQGRTPFARNVLRRGVLLSCLVIPSCLAGGASVSWARDYREPPRQDWSFRGPLGHFDMASVQRGYTVYAQVCSACHGMKSVAYGDLAGLGLKEADVNAIAGAHHVPAGVDGSGHPVTRPANVDDHLLSPYPDAHTAAAANHGVPPPDQSRLAVVHPGGVDRIDAFLTGYGQTPPPGMTAAPGLFYNPYAANGQTAMPPPLHDGGVAYPDGTPATVAQQARDVTTFLAWVASPHLTQRHRVGVGAVVFLLILLILSICLKRRTWSNVH